MKKDTKKTLILFFSIAAISMIFNLSPAFVVFWGLMLYSYLQIVEYLDKKVIKKARKLYEN